jgi:Photoprotection regulator fluorescence recovery protein
MLAGGTTMASLPNSGSQSESFYHRDIKWSQVEKVVARKAFQQALQREFEIVMNEARQRAAKIKEPSDMWDLEDYLTQSRKNIDRDFDYRYSRLLEVFAVLIRRGRLSLEELDGLGEEKLDEIRSTLNYL